MKAKFLIFTLIFSLLVVSVPAFAANSVSIKDNGILEQSKNVTVSISTVDLDENDDLTVLVYKVDEKNTEPNKDNIAYINQIDFVEGKTSITFPMPDDADGLYEVRIGGTDVETYTSGRFSISQAIVGDLNKDGKIDTKDAIIVLKVYLGKDDIGVTITEGSCDLNADGTVDTKDAIWVLRQYLLSN